ncbi:hypothetical protein BH10PAT1_BH10PAT1_1400 [soil metagenome]
MKTVGTLLKEARIGKDLSQKDLENMTHIKAHFINAIEKAKWEELPEKSVLTGFIKSLSHFLDVDENQAVSIFRRDYPPVLTQRNERVKNTKEIGRRFIWGPRLTFLVGILFVVFVVLGYLGIQYRKFNLPPTLIVNEPSEGQTVTKSILTVTGKTDPDATIIINNQSAIPDDNGNFSTSIDISNNTNEIIIKAESRSSKMTTIHRKIVFKP